MKTHFNIDKLCVCLQQPSGFYEALLQRFDESPNGVVSFDNDSFFLSVEDASYANDKDITATVFVNDKLPMELGTFVFNSSRKYGTKCFFTYATKVLYQPSMIIPASTDASKPSIKYNFFSLPFVVFDRLGLMFNNITTIEIACDTEAPVIHRIQHAVSHPEIFHMILLGKRIRNPEQIIEGYWEYFQRSRLRRDTKPTLYIHRTHMYSMGHLCELKGYDKARELVQSRPDKEAITRAWNDMQGTIQRLEVVVGNIVFRQGFARMNHDHNNRWSEVPSVYPKNIVKEPLKESSKVALQHFFYDLGMDETLRGELFTYYANNIIHFKVRNRAKTQVSVLDMTINTTTNLTRQVRRNKGKKGKSK